MSNQQLIALATILILGSITSPAAGKARHPLDPLDAKEIQAAVETVRQSGKVSEHILFPLISLDEPAKELVHNFKPGMPWIRRAFVVAYDRVRNETFEGIIDLTERAVVSWRHLPGAQPAVLTEEFLIAQDLVRAHAGWQEAVRKRGIHDFENVQIDGWAPGPLGSTGAPAGARILRAVSYYRGKGRNPYAKPIEGVIAVVDLNRRQVVEVIDTGVRPLPQQSFEFEARTVGKHRARSKPLMVVQPSGKNFSINGQEVAWENWRFRYALHPREGLVLYTVSFEEQGKFRSVLYRASLSEMVVPYADPDQNWSWRNAFDEGEYGIGRLANTLVPNHDAPSNAVLLDAVFADDMGKPYTQKQAVAIAESDAGILWRHYEYMSDQKESRRARQLELMYIATVGNYDYAFSWIFHQDGRLEVRAGLTGILLPKGVSATRCANCDRLARGQSQVDLPEEQRYGRLVAPHVVATAHQHFLNFRLDFDLDGTRNSVAEMNTRSLPASAANALANAFVTEPKLLERETAAARELNPLSNRKWHIFNPNVVNALGHQTGFTLVPHENAMPLAQPDALVRQRARFLDHPFRVTRFQPHELHAAGPYPNQGHGADQLTNWAANDESLVNEDLVVWYTMGITHHPRPEEWPIMPTAYIRFELVPDGFFDRNPTLLD
ncbi:MAG: primary-amine oxidase [Verrucomicrobiota bacterium]